MGIPALSPPTIGREELALWLNVTPDHLTSKLPRLVAEYGFPPKLPGFNGLWSRAAVIAWIDGVTNPPAGQAVTAASIVPTLEQHYGSAA
ncbi:hypothetical protein [Ancylobacter oerskovii]|uniref:DNA-binding protein n=2 Tax=Ancylobacter oerskovii TaxID=459519 RepID=A0ABW4YS22_9HYPH